MTDIIDGKYRIVRELGGGSVGQVFEVEHIHVGSSLALKLMHDDWSADAGMRDRFLAAGKRAARLRHPAIVQIEDIGVAAGRPYLVMELCSGKPLGTLLRSGRMQQAVACETAIGILAALASAHQQGVLHGDLKPENIMLSFEENGMPRPKVLDFGLARAVFEDESVAVDLRWSVSPPHHAPPESLLKNPTDERSDMYSFAAVLYEMLAARRLVSAGDESAAIREILEGQWQPLIRLNPQLPEPLVRAVESTLELEPRCRISTPQAFARQLAPYLTLREQPRRWVQSVSLDPALRPDYHLPEPFEFGTPSVPWGRVPSPRADSATPQSLLMSPIIPRTPHAPRLESLNAAAHAKPRTNSSKPKTAFPSESPAAAAPLLDGPGKTATLATSAGFSLGAALAWFMAVI